MRQQTDSDDRPGDRQRARQVLTVLTLSRTAVAFQFQSVTPFFSSFHDTLLLSSTGFGLLLGLYMAPGALVALASPRLTRSFGSMRILSYSLLLMGLGQIVLVLAPGQTVIFLARIVAGIGGCIVYIVAVDMVADLSDAGKISSRMGIIASSWPLGNAISLVLLGGMISAAMPMAAAYAPAVLAFGMTFVVICIASNGTYARQNPAFAWRPLTTTESDNAPKSICLNDWKEALSGTMIPGITFALYNVGFIVFSSFTPNLLESQGYALSAATTIGSMPMWIFVISVPTGGVLAGRSRLRDKWIVGIGCLGGALCILLSYLFEEKIIWYILAGFLGGLPTGAMLSSTSHHRHRLFYPTLFLIFFVFLLFLPPLIGAFISMTGQIHHVLAYCIALLIVAFFLFCKETSS